MTLSEGVQMLTFFELIQPMEWLTIGLVVFAGAQVWVQERTEQQRRMERRLDREESVDSAFHYVWAEHFRVQGLADELDRRDLVEMAVLGVLDPSEVLPRDWSGLTRAMAGLSREAGFLGGVTVGLCHDVQRSIGILSSSVHAFAESGLAGLDRPGKVRMIHDRHEKDLEPWVKAVRTGVRELADLLWDVAQHNPRAGIRRELHFSDNLKSKVAQAAVSSLLRRSQDLESKEAPIAAPDSLNGAG